MACLAVAQRLAAAWLAGSGEAGGGGLLGSGYSGTFDFMAVVAGSCGTFVLFNHTCIQPV